MNEEQYAAIREELASNRTEHESYNRRLREHDEKLERQGEILVVLERLTNTVQSLTAKMTEVSGTIHSVDKRLDELEREPADKWKKITWEVVKYAVLAIIGAVVGYYIKN